MELHFLQDSAEHVLYDNLLRKKTIRFTHVSMETVDGCCQRSRRGREIYENDKYNREQSPEKQKKNNIGSVFCRKQSCLWLQ